MFSICQAIHKYDEFEKIISLDDINIIKSPKKIEYVNISCAFDTETSSFYSSIEDETIKKTITKKEEGCYDKASLCYIWSFGFNGNVFYGRTLDEFVSLCKKISLMMNLSSNRILIVYVHNLAFDFQFIRKYFEWERVFTIDDRKVLSATITSGIEFRCSYLLSGYSLEKVGEHLHKYKINKLVGDLDYEKIRHSETPLSEEEMKYVRNDILVVMAYIQEEIENNGGYIYRIPLTKTGYVRKFCRKMTLYNGESTHKDFNPTSTKYYKLIHSLNIVNIEEYEQLKRAFHGGYTHASCITSNKLLHDITSYDFTSSYPSVMVTEKFPMSTGRLVNLKSKTQFESYLKIYCCLFDVTFYNIESTFEFEHFISFSKCSDITNYELDNGRVVDADTLTITLNEVDYDILKRSYKWKRMKISNFRVYKKDYLPKEFILSILKLYNDKTTLKGVEGKEVEYLNSKELLNSCYGMAVTDIIREEITYENDEWIKTQCDSIDELRNYNYSRKRFLFYPWGIWVTAYACRNLWSGIYEFKIDYHYSDTDSLKVSNIDKHMNYINNYNLIVQKKLNEVANHYNINIEYMYPKTIEGITKPLGVWDFDGHYKRFKTLGAKRYMIEKDNGEISITVSGLNKKLAVPYLKDLAKKSNKDIFELFADEMYVDSQHTGKNTHTYIDEYQHGKVVDYLGNESVYNTPSGIHLEETDYTLSISESYMDYLLSITINDDMGWN